MTKPPPTKAIRPKVYLLPETPMLRSRWVWCCEPCGYEDPWPYANAARAVTAARSHAGRCAESRLAVLRTEARASADTLLFFSELEEEYGYSQAANAYLAAGDIVHTLLDDFEGVSA